MLAPYGRDHPAGLPLRRVLSNRASKNETEQSDQIKKAHPMGEPFSLVNAATSTDPVLD